jgi:hypothetical protein
MKRSLTVLCVMFCVNIFSAAAREIKIGIDAVLSGPASYIGEQILLGATLAGNDVRACPRRY